MLARVEIPLDFVLYAAWGTLALINAGLAEGKDRSRMNWFLLSLPLGPVATFLLVTWFEPLAPAALGGRPGRGG